MSNTVAVIQEIQARSQAIRDAAYDATEKLLVIDTLDGHAPVVAEGFVGEMPFYFQARWDGWSFTPGPNPTGECDADVHFAREGIYGEPGDNDASFMPFDEAERLIRWCSTAYLIQQATLGKQLPAPARPEHLVGLRQKRLAHQQAVFESGVK